MHRSLRNALKQYDDTECTAMRPISFRLLILLVFLSFLKLLSQGVDVNNWQILSSMLHGFLEHHQKNLTNENFLDMF